MKLSERSTRGALIAGTSISWSFAAFISILLLLNPVSLGLKLALIGVAASLVSTGFSQLGILHQMKGGKLA